MKRARPSIACVASLVLCASCQSDQPANLDSGLVPPDDADAAMDGAPPSEAGSDSSTPVQVEIGGLDGEVSAVYDAHGILHLRCQSDADCMAALGYFHAANRFFQMDFARRYIRGRLGGLVKAGDLVLEQDYGMRLIMTSAQGEPLEALAKRSIEPATLGLLERYAAGVNAWLADMQQGRNGAKLSNEYDFPLIDKSKSNTPWEVEDTMAVALFMMFNFGYTVETELQAAEVAASFAPQLAADLLSMRPAMTISTTGTAGLKAFSDLPHGVMPLDPFDPSRFLAAREAIRAARRRLARPLSLPPGSGSNNWALAPSRTQSKKAILASDPHLGIANPAMFFPVEIDSKSDGSGTLHVAGGTVAGIPFVLIGRNEKVAWGLTTCQWDLNEVYLEQLSADGSAVMFNGKQVKLLEKTLTFENAAGDPVQKTFKWVPHHGPLISEDLASGTGVSFRWSAAEGVTEADAFLALARVGSVNDLPAALNKITTADQNFVAADVDGNIGWFPYSKIPKRPWASAALPPWLPVPGDGSAEWDGFLPMSELPQGINPPSGFFATANQTLTDAPMDGDPTDEDQAFHSYDRWLGVRMQRIVDMIEARTTNDHTVETMLAMQADTYSLYGKTVTPALLAAAAGATLGPAAQTIVDALSQWKYTCPTGLAGTNPEGPKSADAAEVAESVGCTAFHVVLYHTIGAALGDEIKAAGVIPKFRAQHNVILTSFLAPEQIKSKFWDDVSTLDKEETRNEILLGAIIAAGATLEAIESSPDDWQWGRIHRLSLRSPYSLMGLPSFDDGPYANDGALFTVDVAIPQILRDTHDVATEALDFDQIDGAGLRMVVEASEGAMTMKWQLPGGTSLDRAGPRYNQLLDKYLANEAIDFPFGKGAVTNPSEALTVKPAKP